MNFDDTELSEEGIPVILKLFINKTVKSKIKQS